MLLFQKQLLEITMSRLSDRFPAMVGEERLDREAGWIVDDSGLRHAICSCGTKVMLRPIVGHHYVRIDTHPTPAGVECVESLKELERPMSKDYIRTILDFHRSTRR